MKRLAFAAALLIAAPASAQVEPARERLAGLADFVDGVIAQQIASREVAGAIVTVVADGKPVFTRGYGHADVEAGRLVDGEATLFRPGSTSKLFTWVALMQQVERGRVDLDADVNRYIDFTIPPFEGQPIRVRDLLTHSLGMSDVGGFMKESPDQVVPFGDWIKQKLPERLWPTGTEVAYSNWGTALAGYIVQRVSGEPFADYAERRIFRPLGMTSTTFRDPAGESMRARMARGHAFKDGRLSPSAPQYIESIMPAGSASSSAPDMARFMLAMLNDGELDGARILKRDSVALLERDSIANAPDLPGMAHGYLVYRGAGPRLIGHAGATGEFHSNLVLAPEQDIGFFVSVTGGNSSVARTELSDAITGRLFPQTPAPRWTGTAPPPRFGAYRGNRRDHSQPYDEARDLKVTAVGETALTIEASGTKTYWERIGPDLYERVTGIAVGGPYDRLRFYGDGSRPRLSFASQPYMTYHLVAQETGG